MTELCFKCKKAVVEGCGYYYLGNCYHARCLCCDRCKGKLIGKPFLTSRDKIFCNEECLRFFDLTYDATSEPVSTSVDHSPNQTRSVSPDEPLFIPTLLSSPMPSGVVNRMYRTDSQSSDLSGTSHTSENSYTHDANKKPKKRILKQPHEKKHGHRSKHVHWRLDEVEDSRYEDDDTSLDSSDTYARVPDISKKKYSHGWDDTDEQGKIVWNVNPHWKDGPANMPAQFPDGILTMPDDLDIDLPFDESNLPEGTAHSNTYHQTVNVPSHQLTISPLSDSNSTPLLAYEPLSDSNSTPSLVDEPNQIQLQYTPTQLDTPKQLLDTPVLPDAFDHLQDTATLTSTPVVLRRKKNGVVTYDNSIPPVLKLRDSMVCELEDTIYDNKPNVFQFPDLSVNSSLSVAKKSFTSAHQLSPVIEDTTSLPSVLTINETSQLTDSSVRTGSPFHSSDPSKRMMVQSNKDVMGQYIKAASPVTQEQSPDTPSSCSSSGDIKAAPLKNPSLSFIHTNSDFDLSAAKHFVGPRTNHYSKLNASSTSSLPGNFSSYMNPSKLQDNARLPSTLLSYHNSSKHSNHISAPHGSTSSLPVMANGGLEDGDDIDTPLSELDTNTQQVRTPVIRQKRHHLQKLQSFKTCSPTSEGAMQRLDAIMRDIELEETHATNSLKTKNISGCGACHKPVLSESSFVLDGIQYHPPCFTCVDCGRSLRGKRVCKAKNKLYCEEDFLYCGFRLNQRLCNHCQMPIISQGNTLDQVEAYNKIFHKQCFQCSECYTPIPSEQDSRLLEGRPVCVKCHLLVMYRQTTPTVRRAAQPIQGYSEML